MLKAIQSKEANALNNAENQGHIDEIIKFKMERIMNKTQQQWVINEMKKTEYSDQYIDQRINKHTRINA